MNAPRYATVSYSVGGRADVDISGDVRHVQVIRLDEAPRQPDVRVQMSIDGKTWLPAQPLPFTLDPAYPFVRFVVTHFDPDAFREILEQARRHAMEKNPCPDAAVGGVTSKKKQPAVPRAQRRLQQKINDLESDLRNTRESRDHHGRVRTSLEDTLAMRNAELSKARTTIEDMKKSMNDTIAAGAEREKSMRDSIERLMASVTERDSTIAALKVLVKQGVRV